MKPYIDPDLPWQEQQCYQELLITEDPDGLQDYAVERPRGFHEEDVTAFAPAHAKFDEDNMPEIMYVLEPPPQRDAFRARSHEIEQKLDAAGELMWEQWPFFENGRYMQRRPLLEFPGLPDRRDKDWYQKYNSMNQLTKIGSAETFQFIENIKRRDPRIKRQDIAMRMEPENGVRTKKSEANLINRMQTTNGRLQFPKYCMLSWNSRDQKSQNRMNVLNQLTQAQRLANTTRGSTPGLIDPLQPDTPANRIPQPDYPGQQGRRFGSRANAPVPSPYLYPGDRRRLSKLRYRQRYLVGDSPSNIAHLPSDHAGGCTCSVDEDPGQGLHQTLPNRVYGCPRSLRKYYSRQHRHRRLQLVEANASLEASAIIPATTHPFGGEMVELPTSALQTFTE